MSDDAETRDQSSEAGRALAGDDRSGRRPAQPEPTPQRTDPTVVPDTPPPKRSDDAERFNFVALRDGAVPAASGASSMPPEPPEQPTDRQ